MADAASPRARTAAGQRAPLAGGQPISAEVADQAAQWLTVLMSGTASEAQLQRWQQWRDAHPDHARAWAHIEAVTGRLKTLTPQAAYRSLSPYAGSNGQASPGRRKALNLLLWGGVAGATGVLAARTERWQRATADYATATGQRREVQLQDGSRITLNTRSAIDVRFDAQQRLLQLLAGEIMVTTAHALGAGHDARPLLVRTAQGDIHALGTRFCVRQDEHDTRLSVLESAVEVRPRAAAQAVGRVQAGEQCRFTAEALGAIAPVDAQAAAWVRGQLIADEWRLDAFIAELDRYRAGLLRCDPQVGGLRVSGVFPLDDTDRILAMLPSVLPVRVSRRSRYWVTVQAAGQG
ncbi:Protein FecR [Xanthomonas arboricola]|uniref:FecR domain-containing protein n=1 Tax=Xanthomonas arboricola TaxID=56448 RepID=UPI001E4977CA|nr:FecR domain-containing protein [Xanthomonas arboricola]CAE6707839.1 Protein FecR [Xanthomonas arboricola]CAE6707872.1 Protein FecR [Xanthomonas arboricola]